MWIFTTIGFFSVVEKPDDRGKGTVTIRSRVRSDLEALKEKYLPTLGPIQENSQTDYRFRAKAKKEEFASALQKMALDLDYDNFKATVSRRQGVEREGFYHEVWETLLRLQERDMNMG